MTMRHPKRKRETGGTVFAKIVKRPGQFLRKNSWWHNALIGAGILAILSVIGALFFAFGDQPADIFTSGPVPPVESLDFAIALSKLVNAPIDEGGAIEILNNGEEFVPALLSSLLQAKRTVNFSVFIWKDGEFSDRVLDALTTRQKEGVQVRVLLDSFGSRGTPRRRFDSLKQAGGRVEVFRMPRLGKLTRFHRRNHRRSIVIDGEIGYTGGMAVADQWLGRAQDSEHWRDTMYRVSGPLATSLQTGFVDSWANSTGEILLGGGIYPAAAGAVGGVIERAIHYANSPADDDQSMQYFFLLPILAARQSIRITTPYFIPGSHLLQALQEKARAGVDVRILLPGSHVDSKSTRLSAQSRYDALLEAGVRIYEYRPTFIHAKTIVVDSKWSVIGSPNLNSRSMRLDEENVFGILDGALAGKLEQSFQADLQASDEIRPEQWRTRNPLHRLVSYLARGFDQQS
jgi:cardiolipin synthase